jgi:DNA repair exonuclease SbcCD ATPase subunit
MADVEMQEVDPINPIFNGMVDANPPNGLPPVVFDIQPLTDAIGAAELNGDGTPGDNKRQNTTALRDILQRFGQAFQSNRENNQRYKNIVQTGLTSIKGLINEIGRLLNQLSEEIRRLRQAANAGDENAQRRIAQLIAQRDALTNVINQATAVLGTLVGADGSLTGAIDLNPQQLARELSTIINGLTSERDKSTNILAANDARPLADPIIQDRGAAPQAGPGRTGGGKRKTKRHQKKSKKTNKKRSKKTTNKTAKKGKKMRGGYSYGKSKRRRGRSLPSSSAPSSLSNSSKNVILF